MRQLIKNNRTRILLFALCGACAAFGAAINDTTFNNYMDTRFHISEVARGWTELPREFPGFFVVLMAFSAFYGLGDIRLAIVANLMAAIGMLGMGFWSPNFTIFLCFTFLMSSGLHIYMPLSSGIAVSLSDGKNDGKLLGDLQGVSTFATLLCWLLLFVGFKFLHFSFQLTYALGAVVFLITGILFIFMLDKSTKRPKGKLLLKKRYAHFYWLNILYGARKQVFLTFAPWVLIKVFNQKIEVFAILGILGALVGMLFKPVLGRMIDRLGERFILSGEAVVLVVICLGYAFAENWFPTQIALIIVFVCYIIDQMMMAVSMARVTYVKKIAEKPEDISPTVAMGVSIDHIVAMTVPIFGGLLWKATSYKMVFIAAAMIAIVNFFSAIRIKTN